MPQPQSDSSETDADGANLDWTALWDEIGFGESYVVSPTQLKLAIEVAEVAEDFSPADTKELATQGQEAGQLTVKKKKAHEGHEGNAELLTVGWSLSQEARR